MTDKKWKKKEEKKAQNPWKKKKGKVFRVVLTGGPCGGKTSALKFFEKELGKLGIPVYCIPEVPTLVMNGGLKYPGLEGKEKLIAFETNIIKLQLAHENAFYKTALAYPTPSVIFHDRGLLDIEAYLPSHVWNDVLQQNRWTKKRFLKRYDLVIHFVTAADGAETFYTLSNNTVRSETPELARALDKKVRETWADHPHLEVIGNADDFATKITKAFEPVLSLVRPSTSAVSSSTTLSSSSSSTSTTSTSTTSTSTSS